MIFRSNLNPVTAPQFRVFLNFPLPNEQYATRLHLVTVLPQTEGKHIMAYARDYLSSPDLKILLAASGRKMSESDTMEESYVTNEANIQIHYRLAGGGRTSDSSDDGSKRHKGSSRPWKKPEKQRPRRQSAPAAIQDRTSAQDQQDRAVTTRKFDPHNLRPGGTTLLTRAECAKILSQKNKQDYTEFIMEQSTYIIQKAMQAEGLPQAKCAPSRTLVTACYDLVLNV